MKKEEIKENVTHHHHHYNWGRWVTYFLIIIVALVLVSNIIATGANMLTAKETVYKKCVDGCSKKHFLGQQIGGDGYSTSSFVKEFDRTDCIENCNELYWNLRK